MKKVVRFWPDQPDRLRRPCKFRDVFHTIASSSVFNEAVIKMMMMFNWKRIYLIHDALRASTSRPHPMILHVVLLHFQILSRLYELHLRYHCKIAIGDSVLSIMALLILLT